MNRFVVGFLFDDKDNVALISKNRPEWQRGRLNGIGGHIEVGETPDAAMSREFLEEAGVSLNWRQFCLMTGDGYELYCFTARGRNHDITAVRTMTDEEVGWYAKQNLPANILPNLSWLIPMACYEAEMLQATVIHKNPRC